MTARLLAGLGAGFVLGAAFGVAFGALASVFEGGPTAAVGVAESWAWFAAFGALMGLGWARAAAYDARPHRPRL